MFRTIIGLEIHAQVMSETKAFCSCSADAFEKKPNTLICPVCTGQPGALPVLNEEVVNLALKGALALNCEINKKSSFDRKNYFYPDLPKGYQITQFFKPIAENGFLLIDDQNGKEKKIRIRRLHIEEDAGKLLHTGSENISESTGSYLDLNRCGVPLIEIVTEPDMSSPEEARIFMEALRDNLKVLNVCSGDMEKGALRCDANISVVDEEKNYSSNRVEVKNMNSFKFVEKALLYEKERIIDELKKGHDVKFETRSWVMPDKKTVSMRSKEKENDYRYFPEPDLPILLVSDEKIEIIKASLPELPRNKKLRFIEEYNIPEYDAGVLSSDPLIANFFEEVAKYTNKPKESSNWIMGEVLRMIKEENLDLENSFLSKELFQDLFKLMDNKIISSKMAKDVLDYALKEKKLPSVIVEEKGFKQVEDTDLIAKIIQEAIKKNQKAVDQYKSGKKNVIGYFVGAVMKETKGKANPETVNKIAKEMLEK